MNRPLPTRDAYDRWAESYPPQPHNPLMRAEQKAMLEHWPEVAGRRALDLACGTGRYAGLLAQSGASEVFAVDFSAAMLRQDSTGNRVRANMMQLPFIDNAFEIVISGLALGHATELRRWMGEIGESAQGRRRSAVFGFSSRGRPRGADALFQGRAQSQLHVAALLLWFE